jgi:hypothetical protein
MPDVTTTLENAWGAHGQDPAGVMQQLHDLIPLATTPEELLQISHLGVHIQGEHLGQWQVGLEFLQQVAASPVYGEASASGAAWHRHRASLLLGAADARAAVAEASAIALDTTVPGASHRVRIHAIAASAVAAHQRLDEARRLMTIALDAAAYGPAKADPAARVLASSAHNLAVELAQLPSRDAATTTFMLELAHISGHWWAVAGGPLEAERAEYRLAMCYLAAQQGAQALGHAQRCLAMSLAEGMKPSEQVYAQMAIAECQHLLGDRAAASAARDAAVAVIPKLIPRVRQEAEAAVLDLDGKLAQPPPGAVSR